MTVKIISKDCDPEIANDRSLPYSAFLVEYKLDGMIHYDLVVSDKRVDIFDYYWDRYRNDLVTFKVCQGRTDPKFWAPPKEQERKKK
jgi:hypothetical protein